MENEYLVEFHNKSDQEKEALVALQNAHDPSKKPLEPAVRAQLNKMVDLALGRKPKQGKQPELAKGTGPEHAIKVPDDLNAILAPTLSPRRRNTYDGHDPSLSDALYGSKNKRPDA